MLFDKPGTGRDVRFRGLLAPGSDWLTGEEDLVGVWRTTGGQRFQNYRAEFTVLNAAVVTWAWITELAAGNALGDQCLRAWRTWVRSGVYDPILAASTITTRSRQDQLPHVADQPLLDLVYDHSRTGGTALSSSPPTCGGLAQPNVDKIDVTRTWRDGGRDAVGDYLLGPKSDPVAVEFALEAKCHASHIGAGVRETSRLISRLRHRQFGVFVTTSFVSKQAYNEIRADGHPVVILAGRDIADILKGRGLDNVASLHTALARDLSAEPAPPIEGTEDA